MDQLTLTIPGDRGDLPATFVTPAGDGPFPAVLLLHGTASHRDEAGGMFARLAAALAARGVASVRFDFSGCGENTRPQTDLTVTHEVADARAAFRWLSAREEVDTARVGVLGFSQGGMIATLLVEAEPDAAALVWWSSGPAGPHGHPFAQLTPFFEGDGDPVHVDFGFGEFTFSRTWWEEVQRMNLPTALAAFHGPVLALLGAADTVIDPAASAAALRAAPGPDVTYVEFPGADHIFSVYDPERDQSTPVIVTTADWFVDRFAVTRPEPPLTPAEAEIMRFPEFELPRPEECPDRIRFRDGLVARLRGHRPLLIDVDVPRGATGPVPVVVWLHGGAWMFGSHKHLTTAIDTERVRDEVLAAGFAFASVQYRLSGEATWPAPLHDIKSAVRWLKHHADSLGIDPGRVAAWGESAGGHLAALLATTGHRPELEGGLGVTRGDGSVHSAVCWYPATDLVAMLECGVAEPVEDLLGRRPELAREAGPLHHVSAKTAPVLLIHGADDSPVPVFHSERFAEACARHGVPAELILVPGAGHAFAGTDPLPYIEQSIAYLRRTLLGETG